MYCLRNHCARDRETRLKGLKGGVEGGQARKALTDTEFYGKPARTKEMW